MCMVIAAQSSIMKMSLSGSIVYDVSCFLSNDLFVYTFPLVYSRFNCFFTSFAKMLPNSKVPIDRKSVV